LEVAGARKGGIINEPCVLEIVSCGKYSKLEAVHQFCVACRPQDGAGGEAVDEDEFYDKERPSLVRTDEKAACLSSSVAIPPADAGAGGFSALKPWRLLLRFLPGRGDLGLKFRELAV
jgi:hypothetical protein